MPTKPKLVSKYFVTEGRYLKDDVDQEEIEAKRADPMMRASIDEAEVTEWRKSQMINLDEVRNSVPVKIYGGEHTKVTYLNGDWVIINKTPAEFLNELIQREEFLYEYNSYLGQIKLGKNIS
jgi:hypothetical protein